MSHVNVGMLRIVGSVIVMLALLVWGTSAVRARSQRSGHSSVFKPQKAAVAWTVVLIAGGAGLWAVSERDALVLLLLAAGYAATWRVATIVGLVATNEGFRDAVWLSRSAPRRVLWALASLSVVAAAAVSWGGAVVRIRSVG
jgi:hypothetical protein